MNPKHGRRKLGVQFQPHLEAVKLNRFTYFDFYNRLSVLALSMFEWKNLPESMNPEWLEWCLFNFGMASFLYTKEYGFINTQCSSYGKLNIYHEPIKLTCLSIDGFRKVREVYNGLEPNTESADKECILVKNNALCFPTANTLELYAYRLTQAMRVEDVNIRNQKTPFFIPTDDKNRQTIITAYEQQDDNSPVIMGSKSTTMIDEWKVVKTETPYIADKIQNYRQGILNEALNSLGINSVRTKKERLITDEAEANNEMVNLFLSSFLAPRKRACEYFNRKYQNVYDKKIDVVVRSDLHNIMKDTMNSFVDKISPENIPENTQKLPEETEENNG